MGVLVLGFAGTSGRAHRAKGASVKATGRQRIHLMTLRLRQLHQRLAVDRSRLAAPVPVHEEVQVVLLHGVGAQHGDRFANKGAIAVCHDDFRDEGLGLVGRAALGRAVRDSGRLEGRAALGRGLGQVNASELLPLGGAEEHHSGRWNAVFLPVAHAGHGDFEQAGHGGRAAQGVDDFGCLAVHAQHISPGYQSMQAQANDSFVRLG